MKKVVAALVVVAVVFVVAATIDSCNRHNRSCFGITGSK